jgi:hypothetical protein
MEKERAAAKEGLEVSCKLRNTGFKPVQKLGFSAGPLDKRRSHRPALQLDGLHSFSRIK